MREAAHAMCVAKHEHCAEVAKELKSELPCQCNPDSESSVCARRNSEGVTPVICLNRLAK
jgi:hypothetical protein